MRAGFLSFLLLTVFSSWSHGQTVLLVESPVTSECLRTEIRTRIDGERIYFQEDQRKSQKIVLQADHRFDEKILAVHGKSGLTAKTARLYELAKSSMSVGVESPVTSTIRPDRRLTVAQRTDDGFMAYCPVGPLTSGELNLLGEHFDTLVLSGLLPGKDVSTGGTWDLANAAVIGLCGFEALESHKLTGSLTGIQGDKANFTISGVAKGIDLGAQVALNINATGVYDVSKKKIVSLEWKQEDGRDQGPVSPAFKANVVVNISRLPIEAPAELSDNGLKGVPPGLDAPAHLTTLVYQDSQGLFELIHPRDWHLTGKKDPHTTFRLMDRGDFVAQADITPWQKAAPGQHLDAKDFRDKVLESPGWEPTQVVEEGQIQTTQPGRFIYRVSALGEINQLKVVQTFFLIAGPNGDQAIVAFTTRQTQVGKLAARDVAFVEGLDFGKK